MINNKIEWAKSYPFDSPVESFVFTNNGVEKFQGDWAEIIRNRTAVIAYGSNSSPAQLTRKFTTMKNEDYIPVIKANLHHFDVVYTPMIVSYGSIPATLTKSESAITNVFITFLTDEQLEIMHITEGIGILYDYVQISDCHLDLPLTYNFSIYAYTSRMNELKIKDQIIALEKVSCLNRCFQAMSQREILSYVQSYLYPEMLLDEFIGNVIDNNVFRDQVNHLLSEHFC